ncbi:MAG: hypothetical protein LPK25_04925 [Cyclobacteriaceae bacterium]|nr:hypothetical protein [Cyclobacteriaceae bacterium]MDX5466098.1 hypothetical protein [Cyclobacteriaceae bacterium]
MKISLFLWIVFLIPSLAIESSRMVSGEHLEENNPTVRESTVDIQVRVGDKLYVFGKAQGTLDNVKIGMHLLNFAQNPKISGINANLNQVTWKKLKNGAIQIQSSYQPWPNYLTWIVLPDGKLKMEALSTASSHRSLANLGLGFDLQEEELKSVELNNQAIALMEDSQRTRPFKQVSFEFANGKLNIQSELSDLVFNSNFSAKESKEADFIISFPENFPPSESPSAPGVTMKDNTASSMEILNRMVLWFDFQ